MPDQSSRVVHISRRWLVFEIEVSLGEWNLDLLIAESFDELVVEMVKDHAAFGRPPDPAQKLDVDRAEALANRRGQRALERDAVLADRVHGRGYRT